MKRSDYAVPASLLALTVWLSTPVAAQVGDTLEHDGTRIGPVEMDAAKRARLDQLRRDPTLYERGETSVYTGEQLGAIDFTLGSLGGGALRMDGHARLRTWQIFNNLTELPLPDSFFAVRAQSAGDAPVVRALQTVAQGPFAPMASLAFTGEYPFASYRFADDTLPAEVALEAFSPFVPLDIKSSLLPVAIFKITVTNPTDKPLAIALLQSQQNAVGFTPEHKYDERSWNHEFEFGETVRLKDRNFVIKGTEFSGYGGNRNAATLTDGAVRLTLTSDLDPQAAGYGSLAAAMYGAGDATAQTGWDDTHELHAVFAEQGALDAHAAASGPTKPGKTLNAAACLSFDLKPGESRTVTALLAWHFPNGENGGIINPKWSAGAWGGGAWGGVGNYYTNYWANASEVLAFTEEHLEQLERDTRLFRDRLYSTTLPIWARDRLSSQLAVLKSKTLFWTNDGYVGGWEGTGPGDGSCAGNCAHVWHYAQAHARLFPELARRMTEQQFAHQREAGDIPYRQPRAGLSADGQAANVLQSYREHLLQSDNTWLVEHFPSIRRSMDFFIDHWDADRDGRLTGAQHTTLDCAISGNSSWLGSMYAAALFAAGQMAEIAGEGQLADEYRALAQEAIDSHLNELWNGDYFVQKADAQRHRDYDEGSAIDQLLGQWWASQLGLGRMYPEGKIQTAMASVFRNNFRPDFKGVAQHPREFVADEDAGMQMITWPAGATRPSAHTSYADEVMSGFEYAAIATMLQAGLKEQPFIALKAIHDRYDGRLRQGYEGAWGNWGFSGNPFGDDECGKMYSRAMSQWSVLLAYQGFSYDGPAASIGFAPPLEEADHTSFFSAAEGWGTFTQQQSANDFAATLSVDWGSLPIQHVTLAPPAAHKATSWRVTLDGQPLPAEAVWADGQLVITFDRRTIRDGQSLRISRQ